MDKALPDFENPPVVEVVLSVQFEPLGRLQTPQLGLLWQEFRYRFPRTEDHPPIDPAIERFGAPPALKNVARVEIVPSLPVPRCWFLNEAGTELIQVQQDRFIHNWRKVGEKDLYPRYEQVKRTFTSELNAFKTFLSREHLGELHPNQCEVTYVNHIEVGDPAAQHGRLGDILTVFTPRYTDDFLGLPEEARVRLSYLIGDNAGQPLGRLHVHVEPAIRAADSRPLYVINLTARGRPTVEGIDGVLGFMDIGREWVVRSFTAITTSGMHERWRRRDGH